MAQLKDVRLEAAVDDPNEKINKMTKQINEWARLMSNEDRTKVYKDEAGTNRILIGQLPDDTHGIVISKTGEDVIDAFS